MQWSILYFIILNSTNPCRFTHPSIPPTGSLPSFPIQNFRSDSSVYQSRGRVDPRPEIPGRKGRRDSGSPSGGMAGILDQTHSETSHRERGQGGPRGESAGRYGTRGASEARGLEVARGGGNSQSSLALRGSNGSLSMPPHPCSSSLASSSKDCPRRREDSPAMAIKPLVGSCGSRSPSSFFNSSWFVCNLGLTSLTIRLLILHHPPSARVCIPLARHCLVSIRHSHCLIQLFINVLPSWLPRVNTISPPLCR